MKIPEITDVFTFESAPDGYVPTSDLAYVTKEADSAFRDDKRVLAQRYAFFPTSSPENPDIWIAVPEIFIQRKPKTE